MAEPLPAFEVKVGSVGDFYGRSRDGGRELSYVRVVHHPGTIGDHSGTIGDNKPRATVFNAKFSIEVL